MKTCKLDHLRRLSQSVNRTVRRAETLNSILVEINLDVDKRVAMVDQLVNVRVRNMNHMITSLEGE